MRILIVDDEAIIRKGLMKIISRMDEKFEIVGEAENGNIALKMIGEACPDVVITDIRMPELGGVELVQSIYQLNKERENCVPIKCVILSGYGEFSYAKDAIEAGVSEYILKPVNEEALGRILRKLDREIVKEKEKAVILEQAYKKLQYLSDMATKENDVFKTVLGQILSGKNDKNTKLIKIALEYINEHYSEPLNLEKMADYVHLSTSYFSDLFKQETGINFIEYLTKLRIEHSKNLLKDAKLRINEVSYSVGYDDPNYFSRIFKKEVGLSPGEFRSRID